MVCLFLSTVESFPILVSIGTTSSYRSIPRTLSAPQVPLLSRTTLSATESSSSLPPPNAIHVWIEEAEDGFVDPDENLQDGEICLRAVKAFASDPENIHSKRFLCAGALIQRPDTDICDAWTADALEDNNGGPNLQVLGALQILDDLFQHHLQRRPNAVEALQTFCVQCGSGNDEYSCASRMAATTRGFRSLRRQVEVDSIYQEDDYEDTLDGLVFDTGLGRRRYEQVLAVSELVAGEDEKDCGAAQILQLLPDEEAIQKSIIIKS